jgi:hypothetical protein
VARKYLICVTIEYNCITLFYINNTTWTWTFTFIFFDFIITIVYSIRFFEYTFRFIIVIPICILVGFTRFFCFLFPLLPMIFSQLWFHNYEFDCFTLLVKGVTTYYCGLRISIIQQFPFVPFIKYFFPTHVCGANT